MAVSAILKTHKKMQENERHDSYATHFWLICNKRKKEFENKILKML